MRLRVRTARAIFAACLILPSLACDASPSSKSAPAEAATTEAATTEAATTAQSEAEAAAAALAPAPSERAYLSALPASAGVDERELADADACAKQDTDACQRLAGFYEQGRGTPEELARALDLHTWTCDAGSAFGCAQGGQLALRSPDSQAQARASALLRRGCEGGHLHACLVASRTLSGEAAAEMRALACGGGYLRACDPGVKRGRKAPPQPLLARDVCPGVFTQSKRSGSGTRLHPLGVQLEHEAMLVALPNDVPGYLAAARSSSPGGEAGKRTSTASASLERSEDAARRLDMTLIDLAADCTLQPGTGAAMQAHALAQGAERTQLGDFPAAIIDHADGRLSLHAWIADRCALSIDARGLAQDELSEAARYVNLRALGQLCQAREAGLRAGPR